MRTFSREFGHSYETYSFGYCNFAVRDVGDVLADIYAGGYLPYSGNLSVRDTFYMARSARLPLQNFVFTSENRRVAKKHDGVWTRTSIPASKFDTRNPSFLAFCLAYFAKRHGANVMPPSRLTFILSMDLVSHIVEYRNKDTVVAYVFEISNADMTHFWYSFYDLSYVKQSLGLWLLLDSAREAKARGTQHFYLGTAYGEKGLYKTNFSPVEFWTGEQWTQSARELKTLCRADPAVNLAGL